jgi:hypothetical protein
MFKVLSASKDTYITNKYINGVSMTGSNVGNAASLDLFKLYGQVVTSSIITELSRLLIKFDLNPLRSLFNAGKIDIDDETFNVTLKLYDVYGGQPTPVKYTVNVYPLSQSFDEGYGRDVVKYADRDTCNWITASYQDNLWYSPGAGSGSISTDQCDYINELPGGISLLSTQNFVTGYEDLSVNVTPIISATLVGLIPDEGFRISFSDLYESNTKSYYVKRFAGKNAYNEDKHPKLQIKFDDSIRDDSNILELDTTGTLYLFNYSYGSLTNLNSGSSVVTGSNCILLRLNTPISGGYYNLYFTGSQHLIGENQVEGLYKTNVFVGLNDSNIQTHLNLTGSVNFTPIWTSFDNSVVYTTGSLLTFNKPQRLSYKIENSKYTVTSTGLRTAHKSNEKVIVRVNIFDHSSPKIKLVKRPLELPGLVIRDVYYQVRNIVTAEKIIPFDTTYHSTRCSSDGTGMYFELDTSNLRDQRSYTIDIMLNTQGNQYVYRDTSPVFRINDLEI